MSQVGTATSNAGSYKCDAIRSTRWLRRAPPVGGCGRNPRPGRHRAVPSAPSPSRATEPSTAGHGPVKQRDSHCYVAWSALLFYSVAVSAAGDHRGSPAARCPLSRWRGPLSAVPMANTRRSQPQRQLSAHAHAQRGRLARRGGRGRGPPVVYLPDPGGGRERDFCVNMNSSVPASNTTIAKLLSIRRSSSTRDTGALIVRGTAARRMHRRQTAWPLVLLPLLLVAATAARAQDIEPRAYSNAPTA
jgi:hypothetical protein